MTRNALGDRLASLGESFTNWFEEPLTVRNFVESAEPDEQGDYRKTDHPDNPIQTSGQVEQPTTPQTEQGPAGREESADVEILLPDDVLVTSGGLEDDGGRYLAWPSEIETQSGLIYTVTQMFDERNGVVRCAALHSGEVDDR
ncbi:hypothetical protein [Halomarina oriensis]|uniref:Uncharacterized protein n=1 Tax=Halomarina oriensis TaxID=671145 RepID=A0A6B0GQ86_9EURY|nr:hypothetical protein [Halomarina oriensis]MWG34823.1 hypothetical protein [Halomarina oriensis]